jgi:hypothetical protein
MIKHFYVCRLVFHPRCGLHSIKIKANGVLNILIYTLLSMSSIAVEVMNIASIDCNSDISYPLDCNQDGAVGLVRF